MVFGWLKKNGSSGSKALAKAEKLSQQGRWAEALSYYEDALESDSESKETAAGLRQCREKLVESNLEEAKGCKQASDPERALEHANLAVTLAGPEKDLVERAAAYLKELESSIDWVPPEAPQRLFESSCSCLSPSCGPGGGANGNEPEDFSMPDDANVDDLFEVYIQSLTEMEAAAYSDLGPEFREGFVRLLHVEIEKAKPLLIKVADENPQSEGVQNCLGLLALHENELDEAEVRFSKALELNAAFAPAAHSLAQTLRDKKKNKDACEFMDKWLSVNSADGEGYVLSALCRMDAEDFDGAVEAARKATAILNDEANPEPELIEGLALRKSGKTAEAITVLEKLAARFPSLLDCLIPLGELLIGKGGASAAKASKLFQHLYQLNPEDGWRHLLRTAEALHACGQGEEAAKALDAAKRECGDNADALKACEKVEAAIA